MNKNKTVRSLLIGDMLVGSGFIVTNNPYRAVRTPAGRMVVEGYYPRGTIKAYEWNASTTVVVA